MTKNKILISCVVGMLFCSLLSSKEIAITIDDAPRRDTIIMSGKERAKKIIDALKQTNTQALFFIITQGLNEKTTKRIKMYEDAGHLLANHSHSHFSAKNTPADIYLTDLDKADKRLSEFKRFVKLYRFPYLQEGSTEKQLYDIRDGLLKRGYKNGYVTMDNYDWHMNSILLKAARSKKKIDYVKLEKLYIDTIYESIEFYETLALETLGRSPKHVLLLHENELTAMYLQKLIEHLKAKGWKIISPLDAYTDPIAQILPKTLFNQQGRVAAIAHEKGKKPRELIHKSEDQEYLNALFAREHIF